MAAGMGDWNRDSGMSVFAGYTGDLTCGVWIESNSQGSDQVSPARRFWTKTLKRSQEYGYRSELPAGAETQEVQLCRITGKKASRGCSRHGHSYTDKIPIALIPSRQCVNHDGPVRRERPKLLRQ